MLKKQLPRYSADYQPVAWQPETISIVISRIKCFHLPLRWYDYLLRLCVVITHVVLEKSPLFGSDTFSG